MDRETGHLEREWPILDLNPGLSTPKPILSPWSYSSCPQEVSRLLGKKDTDIRVSTRGPQTTARRPQVPPHIFASWHVKIMWNSDFSVHNKVLLEACYTHSVLFSGCLPGYSGPVEWLWQRYRPQSPKYLLSAPYRKGLTAPVLYSKVDRYLSIGEVFKKRSGN